MVYVQHAAQQTRDKRFAVGAGRQASQFHLMAQTGRRIKEREKKSQPTRGCWLAHNLIMNNTFGVVYQCIVLLSFHITLIVVRTGRYQQDVEWRHIGEGEKEDGAIGRARRQHLLIANGDKVLRTEGGQTRHARRGDGENVQALQR